MEGRLKLHEAMAVVLLKMDNRTGRTAEICETIVRWGLYEKKNGRPLFADQIFLRANRPRYRHLFEVIDRNTIRLK